MRTEGAYTYLCEQCETLFAVVSRFSVKGDFFKELKCPKCGKDAPHCGEGNINYTQNEINESTTAIVTDVEMNTNPYPTVLTVNHIAEIMGVSKRVAYEIMESKGFPLIRIRRSKRANREEFFAWLKSKNN